MKRKIILVISLVTIVVLLASTLTMSGLNKERLLAHIIYQGLQGYHYSGQKIDDAFSRRAFVEYLEYQDINKRFLLASDVKELEKYKDKIDDEFAEGSTELMNVTMAIVQRRIKQVMDFYEEILSKPFDFTVDEYLEFDVDKRKYCENLDELKELWRKILKYRTLNRYIDLLEEAKKEKEKNKKKKIDKKKLEEKARQAVAKSYKYNFNRILQGAQNDALARYINAVVQIYDPHTLYFPPKEKEDFDMEMSGTFEGIGALLGEKDGYVTVSRIIPGGPSWRQKELQPGDLILKVGQADEEPVDITGIRVVDAVKLIRGKKGTLVKLTIKRPNGQTKVIPIVRDVVVIEETFAKSAVLVHDKYKQRIGYIYLPKFYNDFSKERSGRNSSDDVKKELEKLKTQNVQGIILDLRNNSGGALLDAIRMSGHFIAEGPVVQVKDKQHGSQVYKDPEPDVVYGGPLVVLVNSLSASASEILAAALQDYKRAIIIGGNQSFGKGTVQVMLNLDKYFDDEKEEIPSLGALTITIQKFYRIDGKAIQLKGVKPDITLPDRFDYLELGERYYDHPLPWDTIESSKFETWSPARPDPAVLAQKSQERVAKDTRFQLLASYIKKLEKIKEETLQSLQLEKVMAQDKETAEDTEKLEKYRDKKYPIQVIAQQEKTEGLSKRMAKNVAEREKDWADQIKKDIYINETLAVFNDILEMQKTEQK